MGRPHLTEFLLKLATNAVELEKYRAAKGEERIELMDDAGLSREQQTALDSWNARRIMDAVVMELDRESSVENPYHGTTLTLVLGFDHLQLQFCGPKLERANE